MVSSARHAVLSRVAITKLDVKKAVWWLQGIVIGADENTTYDIQDAVENYLVEGTNPYFQDNIEETQTMKFHVMPKLQTKFMFHKTSRILLRVFNVAINYK